MPLILLFLFMHFIYAQNLIEENGMLLDFINIQEEQQFIDFQEDNLETLERKLQVDYGCNQVARLLADNVISEKEYRHLCGGGGGYYAPYYAPYYAYYAPPPPYYAPPYYAPPYYAPPYYAPPYYAPPYYAPPYYAPPY